VILCITQLVKEVDLSLCVKYNVMKGYSLKHSRSVHFTVGHRASVSIGYEAGSFGHDSGRETLFPLPEMELLSYSS